MLTTGGTGRISRNSDGDCQESPTHAWRVTVDLRQSACTVGLRPSGCTRARNRRPFRRGLHGQILGRDLRQISGGKVRQTGIPK